MSKYTWRSPLARMVARPRDVSDNKEIRRVVVHITGTATYVNAYKRRMHPLEHLWLNHFGKRGNVFSTYAICPWGNIWQLASEQERPWSQGWAKRYGSRENLLAKLVAGVLGRKGGLLVPAWWYKRNANAVSAMNDRSTYLHEKVSLIRCPNRDAVRGCSPLDSPLDFLEDDERSPNDNSISIEFIQYQPEDVLAGKRKTRNYKLTIAQYLAGFQLLLDIKTRHGIHAFQNRTFIGHEDVDPWGRGTPKGGGWDPGAARPNPRFSWPAIHTGDVMDITRPNGLRTEVIPTPEVPKWAKMGKVKLK